MIVVLVFCFCFFGGPRLFSAVSRQSCWNLFPRSSCIVDQFRVVKPVRVLNLVFFFSLNEYHHQHHVNHGRTLRSVPNYAKKEKRTKKKTNSTAMSKHSKCAPSSSLRKEGCHARQQTKMCVIRFQTKSSRFAEFFFVCAQYFLLLCFRSFAEKLLLICCAKEAHDDDERLRVCTSGGISRPQSTLTPKAAVRR